MSINFTEIIAIPKIIKHQFHKIHQALVMIPDVTLFTSASFLTPNNHKPKRHHTLQWFSQSHSKTQNNLMPVAMLRKLGNLLFLVVGGIKKGNLAVAFELLSVPLG